MNTYGISATAQTWVRRMTPVQFRSDLFLEHGSFEPKRHPEPPM